MKIKMEKFQISSIAGVVHGVWIGETKAHALAAMHTDAGYDVRVEDGQLVFTSESDRDLCGDVEAWDIALSSENQNNDDDDDGLYEDEQYIDHDAIEEEAANPNWA